MSSCRRPELRELVPWLVNGSLDPTERSELELHLTACTECGAEVRRYEELATALEKDAAAAPSPHPAQLEVLFARIDRGEQADGVAEKRRWPSRLRQLGSATPAPVRWLVVAQLAAVLLLWVAGDATGPRPRIFRTLAEPATTRVAAVRIVFAPDSTEAEIRRLLLEVRAEIVAGPSPLGAYTLALAPSSAGESSDAIVAVLRSRPGVQFAEPIPTRDGPPR